MAQKTAKAPRHPTFGRKLRWIREQRGLKPKELARQLSVNPSTIYQYERGASNITYTAACRLAETLGVHVSFLWDHFPAPDDHQ